MSIEIIVAKAHQGQLEDVDIKREVESIAKEMAVTDLDYIDNTVNLVFVRGIYKHSERKMITVCLLVNKTKETLIEIHGDLRLKFVSEKALIAKTAINFDESFIGEIKSNQALLFHLGIPVKGLVCDRVFTINDIVGSFENVRVTPKVSKLDKPEGEY